jgi:hypothetical protein
MTQPYWTEEAAEAINVVTCQGRAALDLLDEWLSRDSGRRVDRMALIDGRFVVELRSASGSYESTTQVMLDAAIRTCLMIAMMEGER